ncbi:uncharacterized protein [Clytia hemisphaerica]|uniref:Apple domain-containing protein n=1 Tax=Clytia hemisphaerica TaxID=252671 RepID=A0A7M5V2N6_9CNID
MWKIICIISLSFAKLVSTQFVNFKFAKPLKNKRLAPNTTLFLHQDQAKTHGQCVIHCSAHTECWSANYHQNSQVCILYRESFRDGDVREFVEADGWVYYEKKEAEQTQIVSKGDAINKTEEIICEQGKVIHELPYMPEQWKLSFKVYFSNHQPNSHSSILTFDLIGRRGKIEIGLSQRRFIFVEMSGEIGKRWLNGKYKAPLNKWVSVDINLVRFNGTYQLMLFMNQIYQRSFAIKFWEPTYFKDITVYASKKLNAWKSNVVSTIKELLFYRTKEPVTYNNAIQLGVIPRWPKSWHIQFSVKILYHRKIMNDGRDDGGKWHGIIQFCNSTLDQYGCRQPVVAYNQIEGKIEFTLYGNSTSDNFMQLWSDPIELNTTYDIKMQVTQRSRTRLNIWMNGDRVYKNVEVLNAEEFYNVRYYYGTLWRPDNHSVEISNLIFGGMSQSLNLDD